MKLYVIFVIGVIIFILSILAFSILAIISFSDASTYCAIALSVMLGIILMYVGSYDNSEARNQETS